MSTSEEKAVRSRGTAIVRVVFTSLVGTAVEWYDFFLYGSAAALVFGSQFFPKSDPVTGTLLAFGTYALGFVARPLGGVVFGHFGDRAGRQRMLVVSLLMMGLATIAIGLLPTYASIGLAAPLLLLGCRLVQGFAVGGEWGGAVLMAAEHGDDARRGFWSSWPQAGVALGNLLATAVLWVLALVQPDAAFDAWGWRIPFLLSAVLVLTGLWVRLSVEESPLFRRARASLAGREHRPLLEVVRRHPREVVLAIGMRLAENNRVLPVPGHLDHLPDHVRGKAGRQGHDPDRARDRFGRAVRADPTDRVALRSDRPTPALPGRRDRRGAVDLPVPQAGRHPLGRPITLAVVVGLVLHALMYAPQAAFFAELFGTTVRYTGASVGYQLASILAGAPAPIIALELLGDTANPNLLAVTAYLAIASALTVIAVLAARETARSSLDK
ncbi:MFS transporter [Actinoplanes subtropicus]|uniref:MFS transporter n=1 Tax=Actinoplanes subtropicus TaxID=543632 RepID=UPI001FDF1B72|nr:MFS transporter [Actinoplanes subtropicus]